jgi:hypothetical protein
MPTSFSYEFDTPVFKGKTSFETGLFIDGKFVDGVEGGTIEYVPIVSLLYPVKLMPLTRIGSSIPLQERSSPRFQRLHERMSI